MNERDTEAADDWIRDHMADPGHFSFEDNEEEGDTQKYFFRRYRDSASGVFLIVTEQNDPGAQPL